MGSTPPAESSSPTKSTPPSSPPSAASMSNSPGKDDSGTTDASPMASRDPVSAQMLEEEERMRAAAEKEDSKDKHRATQWGRASQNEQKGQFNKLMHLVEQSKVFASIMQQRMQQEEEKRQQRTEAEKRKTEKQDEKTESVAKGEMRRATRGQNHAAATSKEDTKNGEESNKENQGRQLPVRGKGRPKKGEKKDGSISSWLKKDELNEKAGGMGVSQAVAEAAEEYDEEKSGAFGAQNLRSANQPAAVSGGVMRGYQLEGLYWLRSLYENGLNGILADEMGLGKTIQTISFLAFLREMRSFGPFLIVAPLSTLGNWIAEFERWTPSIKTLLYHGNPTERAELRAKRLIKPGTEEFPVVCTSYEICMNDRKFLSQYGWKFIIIDEGHRLKNLNCRLIKELKQYQSANRLLITGTPLQNNLAELWSLLNFLMPEVFDTLENFESFFDFSAVLEKGGHKEIIEQEQKSNLVASLHAILKPFLLRRVKTDVETELPKKREYILYAPMTPPQKELYKQIIEGNVRKYLEEEAVDRMLEKKGLRKTKSTNSLKRKLIDDETDHMSNKSTKSSRASTPASTRSGRKAASKRKSYAEVSDRQYFKDLEQESSRTPSASPEPDSSEAEDVQRSKTIDLAKRQLATKKLQNPIMQLRLACNSPHNFFWPWTSSSSSPDSDSSDSEGTTPDNTLITSSGKLLLLSSLIPYLLSKSHKLLIFSQFTSTLDILSVFCSTLHSWPTVRIDGSVPHAERSAAIASFNDPASETNIFLLSTRAGGQGINLAAADTVVLFDSDWNPQQDLQAQDRAHRIGQTRPVVVYRLATRGTVEQTLLEKADGKRRLEKLVIRKGKFRNLKGSGKGNGKGEEGERERDEMEELAAMLERGEGEGWDLEGGGEDGGEGVAGGNGKGEGKKGRPLLSEADLEILTDRSDEAYARAERGESGEGGRFRAVETRKDEGVLASVSRR